MLINASRSTFVPETDFDVVTPTQDSVVLSCRLLQPSYKGSFLTRLYVFAESPTSAFVSAMRTMLGLLVGNLRLQCALMFGLLMSAGATSHQNGRRM